MGRILSSFLKLLVLAYRWVLSPILGPGKCRFYPTCSTYALEALKTQGPWRGVCSIAKRLCRCHPFSNAEL